jgi:hypothetical protein
MIATFVTRVSCGRNLLRPAYLVQYCSDLEGEEVSAATHSGLLGIIIAIAGGQTMRTLVLLLTVDRLVGGSKKLDCFSTGHKGADDLAERVANQ